MKKMLDKEDWVNATSIYLADAFGKNVSAEVYKKHAYHLYSEYVDDYFYWSPEDAVEDYLFFTKGELN